MAIDSQNRDLETDFNDIDESFAEKRGKSQPSETSSNYGGIQDNQAL